MKGRDLIELKEGQTTFDAFVRAHRDYLGRLAAYFFRRTSWARPPLGVEDLVQIGSLELWVAVGAYRWRCPLCPRRAASLDAWEAHKRRHGRPRSLWPDPGIFKYVHARVGRAMEHELRRHVRRSPHHVDELFDYVEPSMPPNQEAVAELRQLVDRAAAELGPVRSMVLAGMAFDVPANAHGVSARVVGQMRREVREKWLLQL